MWTLNLEEKHLKLLTLNLQIIIIIGHSTYNFILFFNKWTLNQQVDTQPTVKPVNKVKPRK